MCGHNWWEKPPTTVIKLETNFLYDFDNSIIFFKSMSDCEKYLHVFKDHWCNVPWKNPVEVPYKTGMKLVEEPKRKAERDLTWGFSYVRFYGIKDTPEQMAILGNLTSSL